MNLTIRTSEDMYRAFLRGIRKENTSVVNPTYWNPFINEEVIKWVKSKLPMVEFNQKRIDDLGILRVVTDSSTLLSGYESIKETATGNQIYSVPAQYTQLSGSCPFSGNYPQYLHGLNASFRKGTRGTVTTRTSLPPSPEVKMTYTAWKGAKILRSDKSTVITDNPFRVASENRIYFEKIGDQIRMTGGIGENELRLEYIRYPKIIQYSTVLVYNYNPEFTPSQCQEIIEQAVRSYLERIMDPRYKTFLQEQMIQSQSN